MNGDDIGTRFLDEYKSLHTQIAKMTRTLYIMQLLNFDVGKDEEAVLENVNMNHLLMLTRIRDNLQDAVACGPARIQQLREPQSPVKYTRLVRKLKKINRKILKLEGKERE